MHKQKEQRLDDEDNVAAPRSVDAVVPVEPWKLRDRSRGNRDKFLQAIMSIER